MQSGVSIYNARPIFLCEIEQFGGAERACLALSRWLSCRGLANYILTYKDHCNLASYASHRLEVVSLEPGPRVRKKVESLRHHLKQQNSGAPVLLCSGYQPALHATLAGIRGFHSLMHDTPSLFADENANRLHGKVRLAVSNMVVGYGLRSGGATIVTSNYLKSECWKDFGLDAHILRMGGHPAGPVDLSPQCCKKAGQFRMLSICRLEANKRIDWILRALSQLEHASLGPLDVPLSKLVDWRLDLVGTGSGAEALARLGKALGIAERINFHGFVPDKGLEALTSQCDLFLMPAVQGYGIPAVEAIQRRTPILIHRESGVSDLLLDTPWATVFQGGEDRLGPALASAILGALNGFHLGVSLPWLPTEDEWAEQVAKLCGWV